VRDPVSLERPSLFLLRRLFRDVRPVVNEFVRDCKRGLPNSSVLTVNALARDGLERKEGIASNCSADVELAVVVGTVPNK
ncbi:MAG: hypothetical protein KAJ52_10380, partial [Sedimentisphaerales bacterium]|nr:hypothetical protein [Sedimentisphaerales bacterium]